MPPWYEEAKLGILICWGPFAVPGWAPPTGEPSRVAAEQGWESLYHRDSRSEWYGNGMSIPGSPTQHHHRAVWGRLTRYDSFVQTFRQGLRDWDPAATLEPLAQSGARYLIATAKPHDGFAMWPARRRNPRRNAWQSSRDVLGELAGGARSLGWRFGVYYSGGLDWTFGGIPIRGRGELLTAIPRSRSYASYAEAHWRELISRYAPSVLWNDVGSPALQDLRGLLNAYYAEVPDGVVNDRFGQADPEEPGFPRRFVRGLGRALSLSRGRRAVRTGGIHPARHADFHTVDSDPSDSPSDGAWEYVRALGFSWGYSSQETREMLMDTEALVRLLCDVAARGGNLLLCVGPRADGSIPPEHAERLQGLGAWLRLNGEAIYGTRPWGEREGATTDGVEVRFTTKGMTAYAILLGTPPGRTIVLPSLRLLPYASVRVSGSVGFTAWSQEGRDVHVRLSEPLRESPAHVISITPLPRG